MKVSRAELDEILGQMQQRGFQPLGMLFYSPEDCLLGLCPLDGVPEAWIELIGQRLSGLDNVKPNWTPISKA